MSKLSQVIDHYEKRLDENPYHYKGTQSEMLDLLAVYREAKTAISDSSTVIAYMEQVICDLKNKIEILQSDKTKAENLNIALADELARASAVKRCEC